MKANRASPTQPCSHQQKFLCSKAMADTPHALPWKAQRGSLRIREQNTLWAIQNPENTVELEATAIEQKYFSKDTTAGDFMAVQNISSKIN